MDVGSIKQGDRISIQFPSWTRSQTIKIEKLTKWGHSEHFDAPYVDFFNDQKYYAVALPFITHLNGRRVNREYWNGRNANLQGLIRDEPLREERKKPITVVQIRLPFNEEDDLATSLKTSTRKGLDEMSDSHRAHIEKWEDHVEAMGAEHVWASTNRFAGRGGEGPVYAAIKRGSKDYAIVSYDTSTGKKAKVLVDGFESSKTLMEAFKEYREMAKEERGEDKPKPKKAAPAKATKAVKKAGKSKVVEDDDEDEEEEEEDEEEEETPVVRKTVKKIARKRR